MDCKSMSIGEKRNRLIEMACGDYVVFVDDDDNVPDYYLIEILNAIKTGPDCVGIRGVIKYEKPDDNHDTVFIHSLRYPQDEDVNIYAKGRPPNHLNPIKREIAATVKFPDKNWAEDKDWAESLYYKLKTEKMIEKVMYVYFAFGSKSQSSPDCRLSHI
jgi:glycosyltransferase involved in cell wall biosynthesis